MNTDDTKDNEKGKLKGNFSDKEIFKMALASRNFEIKMFWQRCNYFLLLNTSVGAAVVVVLGNEKAKYLIPFLCLIGMFVCFAWIKVGLGAKFWQQYWEQVVEDFQGNTGLWSSEKDIFSNNEGVVNRVEIGYGEARSESKIFLGYIRYFPLFLGFFYEQRVLDKPSVSRWMHRTACFFFWAWFVSLVAFLIFGHNLYHTCCS